jgi:hypothetical protein
MRGVRLVSGWQGALADDQQGVALGHESYPLAVFRAKILRSAQLNHRELRNMGTKQNPAANPRPAGLTRRGPDQGGPPRTSPCRQRQRGQAAPLSGIEDLGTGGLRHGGPPEHSSRFTQMTQVS